MKNAENDQDDISSGEKLIIAMAQRCLKNTVNDILLNLKFIQLEVELKSFQ